MIGCGYCIHYKSALFLAYRNTWIYYIPFIYRRCYFTTAAVHKRIEFITQLNTTFGSGGLICSFTEFDLAQFIQWKCKIFHHNNGVEAKKGTLKLGMQPCGKIWVFSDKMFIDVNGLIIVSHHYVWLSRGTRASIMSQKEVSLDDITCSIKEPCCQLHHSNSFY